MRKSYREPLPKMQISNKEIRPTFLGTISLAAYGSDEVALIFWDKPQEKDSSIIFLQIDFFRKSIVLSLCPTICSLRCIINKN